MQQFNSAACTKKKKLVRKFMGKKLIEIQTQIEELREQQFYRDGIMKNFKLDLDRLNNKIMNGIDKNISIDVN